MSTIVGRVLNLNYLTYSFQQLKWGHTKLHLGKERPLFLNKFPFPGCQIG